MCAYAAGFRAERATLVYPTLCDQKTSRRVLLNTTYGNRPFLIESAACEIASGPECCKRTLLRELFSSGK
jgi:hypothetical protein